MPKIVEKTVPAEGVRKGHKLIWRNREWNVEAAENKVKYTTVRVTESVEPFRIERAQNVKVRVLENTDKEKYDSILDWWVKNVKRNLEGAEETLAQARQEFRDDHAKWNGLQYYMVENMVEAETVNRLHEQILNQLYRMDPLEPQGRDQVGPVLERADDEDLLEAYGRIVEQAREEVWSKSGNSTNQMSNAISIVETDAKRTWVNRHSSELEALRLAKEKALKEG